LGGEGDNLSLLVVGKEVKEAEPFWAGGYGKKTQGGGDKKGLKPFLKRAAGGNRYK